MDKFLVKRSRPADEEADHGTTTKAARPELASEVVALLATLTDETWKAALEKEACKEYFADLARAVQKERERKTIYPPASQVFTAFNLTPLPAVRVVILGQDPCVPHPQCTPVFGVPCTHGACEAGEEARRV